MDGLMKESYSFTCVITVQRSVIYNLNCPTLLAFTCIHPVSRMLPAPLMTYQYQRIFIKAASESFTHLPLIYLSVAFRDGAWIWLFCGIGLFEMAAITYYATLLITAEIPVFVFGPTEADFINGL